MDFYTESLSKHLITTIFVAMLTLAALGGVSTNTYLNEYALPVVIQVPYYKTKDSAPELIDITLKPGDLYEGCEGRNGYVYEKYGLMPGIMEEYTGKFEKNPVVYSKEERALWDAEYAEYQKGLLAETMPENWVEENKEKYKDAVASIQRMIELKTNLIANSNDEGSIFVLQREVEDYVSEYNSITNIQDRINDLTSPESDPDHDGLNNRTEFCRGSNPWLEDYITAYPKIVQIVPDKNTVATGVFYVVNTLQTNITIELRNILNRIKEPKYFLNFAIDGTSELTNAFTIGSCSTNKIYVLLNALNFPPNLGYDYFIRVCDTNKCYSVIKLYTPGDYSKKLQKPTGLNPANGTRYEKLEKLCLGWQDDENNETDKNYVRTQYKPQIVGVNHDLYLFTRPVVQKSVSYDISVKNPDGIHIWRVNKQDVFSDPVSSDWSWFSVGREIAPEKGKASAYDQAWISHNGQTRFVYAFAEKPYDLPMGSYQARESSRFLEPLMKNQILYRTNESFRIKGVFSKPGVYTNTWLDISSDGKTNDIRQYFIVRNPAEKKNVRSYYYLKDKTIVHELFVNVPFQYKERQFFENFSKTEDLVWDKNLTMQFDTSLPKGLNLKKTEDGEDLEIMGVPLKAGDFKTCLVFSNGKSEVKEKHIFKIKDIGEPCLEPEKKFKTMYKKFSSSCVTRNRGVFHSSYVGLPMTYCFYRELKERPHDYIYYISNCTVKVIGKLPEGIVVTNLPLTAEEGYNKPLPEENSPFRKMFDKFYRDRDKVWYGFTGTPIEAGTFTNLLVFTEPGNVFTNRHIFIIKKDLD